MLWPFMKKRRDFQCDRCEKAFADKSTLSQHIKSVHDDIRDVKCNLCGNMFRSNQHVRRHINQVHKGLSRKFRNAPLDPLDNIKQDETQDGLI